MLTEWSTQALLRELERRGRELRLDDAEAGAALEDYSRQMLGTLPSEALAVVPAEPCAPVY